MQIKNKVAFTVHGQDFTQFKIEFEKQVAQNGLPTVGIIYYDVHSEFAAINKYLAARKVDYIGASTPGIITNNTLSNNGISAIFMYIPKSYYTIHKVAFAETQNAGVELGEFAKSTYSNPGIYALISGMNVRSDLLIKDIQSVTHEQIPIHGGNAMDDLKFNNFSVAVNGVLLHEGLASIIFDCDKINLIGAAISGWDSIGITHTVTKSSGNELLEIDNQPALSVFHNYFSYFDLEKIASGEDRLVFIGNHPIKVVQDDGQVVMKSALTLNIERQSMNYICSVPVGTKFKFCTNPSIDIINNLAEKLNIVKNDYPDIDALLVSNCIGRYNSLGPFFKDEVTKLFNVWEVPMVGFLSAGEIGNNYESKKSHFHNVTCSVMGLKIK